MTTEIAKKLEFILSGRGTSKEEFNEIIDLMEEYKQLTIPVVVGRSEQLECDCTQPPFRYNELGTCKYCGKQKKEAL